MSDLLFFVFSPSGATAALLVSGVWAFTRPGSPVARRFLLVATAVYGIASIYVVPATVAGLLAHGYHAFDPADVGRGKTAIVVLGGGCDTVDGWNGARTGVLGGDSAGRVLEAARVSREVPEALVISSGGVPSGDANELPVAAMMRDRLLQLGVPQSRIIVETMSRNTHDEAVVLSPILRARAVRQIILVTSDVHMRRSLGTFRREGWEVIPAIAPHPNFDAPWRRRLVPTAMGLYFSAAVVHELCGIPYYWARGWWR